MTTARRKRASSRSTLKPRTPGVATRSGNATMATGAAGESASATGSRRNIEGALNTTRARSPVCGPTERAIAEYEIKLDGLVIIVRRFDVAYDDGEAETRVEEHLIRSLDGGGRGSRSPSPRGGGRGRLREGAKIEARYRGRSRYYPGRIARDRGDGTFDVDCATQRPCLHTRGRRVTRGRV